MVTFLILISVLENRKSGGQAHFNGKSENKLSREKERESYQVVGNSIVYITEDTISCQMII